MNTVGALRQVLRDEVRRLQPPPGLEARVLHQVLASDAKRPRRPLWTYRLRGPAAIVAAALVVLLIAGLILGGRFWRDLNATPSTVDQKELKSLESVPLNFPTVSRVDQCPQTPTTLQSAGLLVGDGPFFVLPGHYPLGVTKWGNWAGVRFVYTAKAPGLVLIRAQDLVTGQKVVFAQFPTGQSGVIPDGRVLGTDYVKDVNAEVRMRAEAVVQDPSHSSSVRNTRTLPPLDVMIGLPGGGTGCIGFQVDGPNFANHVNVYQPTPWTN